MSLTVSLYYTGKDGSARKSAGEEGNERYESFIPMNDPQTVLLIDSWRDQKALDAHHASKMMKQLAELREKYDLHMKAEWYVSVGEPESEERFIRK